MQYTEREAEIPHEMRRAGSGVAVAVAVNARDTSGLLEELSTDVIMCLFNVYDLIF